MYTTRRRRRQNNNRISFLFALIGLVDGRAVSGVATHSLSPTVNRESALSELYIQEQHINKSERIIPATKIQEKMSNPVGFGVKQTENARIGRG